jgi:hypothetical protein
VTHPFLVSDRPPHFSDPARCSQGPPRGMRLSALSVNPSSFPFHRCAINLKLSPHLLDAAKKQVCSFIAGLAICFLPFASGELGALNRGPVWGLLGREKSARRLLSSQRGNVQMLGGSLKDGGSLSIAPGRASDGAIGGQASITNSAQLNSCYCQSLTRAIFRTSKRWNQSEAFNRFRKSLIFQSSGNVTHGCRQRVR